MTNDVLVLNQFALPRDQGGGTRHAELFDSLPGWRATIVAGNRNHYTQQPFVTDDPRFTLIPVPHQDGQATRRLLSWVAYCARAVAIGLRDRDLTVVYASTPHLLTPLAGMLVARARRVPLVLEVRDLWPESIVAAGRLRRGGRTHRLLTRLERFIASAADHVVVVTDGWSEHFTSLGVSEHDLTVIPNGSDPWPIEPGAQERARDRLGVSGFTAVFAGAHGPKDGLDHILAAAKRAGDISFVLIGDGPDKQRVKHEAIREGLTNVSFLDSVSKQELRHVLPAFDVGIHAVTPLPVFDQGMSPNKLFDYLAAGLPVVSNCGTGLNSIISGTHSVLAGGPDSLAASLEQIRDMSQEERSERITAGRGLLEQRFSRTQSRQRLLQVLDRVAGSPAARRTRSAAAHEVDR